MKTLIISLLIIITVSLNISAQSPEDLPINNKGKIDFTEVVEVEGENKDVLYSRAREWFVNTFNSADDVIQMDDKGSGKVIGKAFSDITLVIMNIRSIKVKFYYTISVYLKDNRYKYSISNLFYEQYPSDNPRFVYFGGQQTLAEDVILIDKVISCTTLFHIFHSLLME